MSWLPRQLAPAGSPITSRDLRQWLATCGRWSRVSDELREAIRGRFGVRHCFLTSTGRAGLTVILRAMRDASLGDRTEVVMPSYTCYSVAAAIVKAGLVPRVVDIDCRTLDFDPAKLYQTDFRRVVAIVATSLYGLPANLPMLEQLAQDHGVYLIDDAAQAMGATIAGRPCGTFGDAGLLSFDKGKGVSAIDGGVILTNSDGVAAAVSSQIQLAHEQPTSANLTHLAKALVYAIFLRPSLYAVPNALPWLGLGVTRYTTDFAIERCSPLLSALALTMLPHLEQFVRTRTSNARILLNELQDVIEVQSFSVLPNSNPSYVRLPMLARDSGLRNRLLVDLKRAGIGASGSYPASIVDVTELRTVLPRGTAAPAGQSVSLRMLTLPTHPYLLPDDLNRVGVIVRRALLDDPSRVSAQLATN